MNAKETAKKILTEKGEWDPQMEAWDWYIEDGEIRAWGYDDAFAAIEE